MNDQRSTSTTATGASDDTGVGGDELARKAGNAADRISTQAGEAARQIGESRFEQGRDEAASQIQQASGTAEEVARTLDEQDSPFASYASELSAQLSSLSDKVSNRSLDGLMSDARSLARENPAAFMLGSVAVGLAAARFFKAAGMERGDTSGSDQDASDTTPRSASEADRASVETVSQETRRPELGIPSSDRMGARARNGNAALDSSASRQSSKSTSVEGA